MILAIVGTRKLNDKMAEYAEVLILHEILSGKYDSVVTGDASGIDELAQALCAVHGVPCESLKPNSRMWEPDGFKDRNIRICKKADAMLCIRDPDSLTYGSGWTAQYFACLGKGLPWIVEMR